MRSLIIPTLLCTSLATAQECRIVRDSTDAFTNERFVEVVGPEEGSYPRYVFLAEHKRYFVRWTWAVSGTHHAVALVGDALYLRLTNGRVLQTYVTSNAPSVPIHDDTAPRTAMITFEVELGLADLEVLSQQWVSRMRMHFTTGGIQDLDTRTMSVWPMDLAHTAKCFLQQLEDIVQQTPAGR